MSKDIYLRIKKLRVENNMTQDELAEKTGYADKTAISHIESGKRNISQSKIVAFAKALNTTTSYLMDGIEEDIPDIAPGIAEIIDLFSRATPEQQIAVLNLLRSFVSDQNKK